MIDFALQIISRVLLALGASLVMWTYFLMSHNQVNDEFRVFMRLFLGWILIIFMGWFLW